jgi:hypothetical protein
MDNFFGKFAKEKIIFQNLLLIKIHRKNCNMYQIKKLPYFHSNIQLT